MRTAVSVGEGQCLQGIGPGEGGHTDRHHYNIYSTSTSVDKWTCNNTLDGVVIPW